MHRAFIAAGLLLLAAGAHAADTLPAVNLVLQFRLQAIAVSPQGGSRDVVVSTSHPVSPGNGGWVVSTAPSNSGAAPALPLMQVRNGGQSEVALTQWRLAPQTRWYVTAGAHGTAASGAGQANAANPSMGLSGGEEPLAEATRLWVAPTWPGGNAPVRVQYRVEWPSAAGQGARPADAAWMSGEVLAAMGQWVMLGRLARPSGTAPNGPDNPGTRTWRSGNAAASAAQQLEVRVLRP
ncbi:MAG TPA: hypothetical protein VLA61_21125 [Ideonella sp.]|uniref:hypothetical protein n=1 Tax=Ideonella sp. TaxID=1929293 RepID=UPI002C46A19A|nr:hypothetical protein [Ideonella sp.]HSI50779.1 hypothetical protein [Ideonella sp.]